MSQITDAQRVELSQNQSFKDQVRKAIENYAVYISGQDGTSGNLGGLSPIEWAKRRYLSKGIMLNPNQVIYADWESQFVIFLKGQDVWNTDAATTISAMISSGKFEELSNLAFALRSQRVEM